MAILGKFTKQPEEIESYSISYAEAVNIADSIVDARVSLVLERGMLGKRNTAGAVQLTVADSLFAITVSGVVTLPPATVGIRFFLTNTTATPVNVNLSDGSTLHVLGQKNSVVISVADGIYVVEATARSLFVSDQADQRAKVFVGGGIAGGSYKAEVTVSTGKGRVLQDEFLVRVKDF